MSRLPKTITCFLLLLTIYPFSLLSAAELSPPSISESKARTESRPVAKQQPDGHSKEISVFALSRDGLYALTGDEDENNFLWDVKSGKKIREIGKPDPVRIWVVAAAFSPDSSTLVWSRYRKHTPVLWDVKSGKKLGILLSRENGHKSEVVSLAFSNDGRYIASGDMQGVIVVWNVKDRSVVHRYQAHSGEISQIIFIPGGNDFASAGIDGAVYLWNVEKGNAIATLLPPSDDIVTSLTVSSNGSVLYAASDNLTVKGWNLALRSLRSTITFKDRLINNIALSPNGNLLAVIEEDESVLLWNFREGKPAWNNQLQDSALTAGFSPDGASLFTSGGDNWVREWDVSTGRLLRKFGGVVE